MSTILTELTEWELALLNSHRDMITENNTRDIGKARQAAAEYIVKKWINDNFDFHVGRRADFEQTVDDDDHNEGGWDLLEPATGMRIQVKYRGGKDIHLEQTRRHSVKNQGDAVATGHAVYSSGEFDVLVVVRPKRLSNTFCAEDDIIVIAETDLRNPKKEGFLLPRVGKRLEQKLRANDPKSVLTSCRNRLL